MPDRPAFSYRPIGIIHSPFQQMSGTPIQPVFARGVQGRVEVFEDYAEGLSDLELFSHIYLLFHFDRAGPGSLRCTPYLDSRPRGVFATRAPRRPNGLGLSIVHLLGREGGTLRVEDIDVLDGTPLLDIKPYVPRFDARGDASNGWLEHAAPDAGGNRADGRFEG